MNFWIIIGLKEVIWHMNNKYVTLKTFYITLLFFFCFILLCIFSAVHFINIKEKEILNSIAMPVQTIQNNQYKTEEEEYIDETDVLYVVAEHDGRIGIFNANCTTVFEILDVYVDYLPDIDRQYLKNGIEIYTNDELLSVIADYTS